MAFTGYQAFWESSKIIFGINAVGYTITALTKTHKITDLIGCATFGLAAAYTLYKAHNTEGTTDNTQKLLTYCVCAWSIRLGLFLFMRVNITGDDKRLHQFYPNPKYNEGWFTMRKGKTPKILKLAFFWLIQATWALVVSSPVIMSNLCGNRIGKISKLTWSGFIGFLFFFIYECVADYQKFNFKQNPLNKGKFCNIGLYKYSRFPNYAGEIGVWFSIFLMAFPVLKSSHCWTAIAPIFTFLLLNNLSGVPLLEAGWKKKYGNLKQFKQWKANTNKYIPL